jgi:CDP-4-dehydro-6-deoxyglucose reductase, E1
MYIKNRELIEEQIKKLVKDNFEVKPLVSGQDMLPAAGKVIDDHEVNNIISSALDGWLTTGRFNEEFQNKLKKYLGVKWALTVNSGSSANLIALACLTSDKLKDAQLKPGDEVITVAAGFPTTVNPIVQLGFVPVFVDIDPITYNINTDLLEGALSSKTRAIMLAHTLGNPFDLDKITKFCKKHNLYLIEDCCDALGAKYNGNYVGTFGDTATLSFYPAHHITMGEGGVVFTNKGKHKLQIESYRDWGRDCYCLPGEENSCGKRFCWKLGGLPYGYDHKYTYSHLGYNLKITDMQASCGLAQLDKLDGFIAKRRENHQKLKILLADVSDSLRLPEATPNSDPSWFGFIITIQNNEINREKLLQYLADHNIGTRLLFAGNVTQQPYFKNINYRIASNLNVTDNIMHNAFWVGCHPGLSDGNINYIAEKIKAYVQKK